MSELNEQETMELLSKYREDIIQLVTKYNLLAKDKNVNTRIAYATASSYADDEEDDIDDEELEEDDDTDFYENKINEIKAAKTVKPKRKTNYEKVVSDSWGENVGVSIDAPEAGFWFPSSICQ